jgi:hypothetical protein
MKTLLVLLAACGLLLLSQQPARAQVSWGFPLPFPFLFYNFHQDYYGYGPQPYYGRRAYYSQGRCVRPYCVPGRRAYYYRGYYYGPRYDYAPEGYYWPNWGYYGGGW